jgi:hypothetical protein
LLTATINNGGAGPVYQWQDSTASANWQNINGANAATLNYIPAKTGDKVRCMLTSNASCASPSSVTSTTLTFTVNNVTAINPVPAANYGIIWYPNPVTGGTLYIDSLNLMDKWQTLEITGMDGKQKILEMNIANRSNVAVNVSKLRNGYYVIILRRKQGLPVYLKFLKF